MASARNLFTGSSNAVYLPLADSNEIRLLYLQPGKGSDTIKCSIQNTALPSSPPYEALSYMWGPKVYKIIELDGKPFSVTENLWQALTHLRYEDDLRTLWVDAICINQKDVSERNHQVRQMGMIYSQALRVLAWLGLADLDSRLAFQACKSTVGGGRTIKTIVYLSQLQFSEAELKAIDSLCSREYWSRLWIIQEVILAKDVLLCCGNQALEWSFFHFVLKNSKNHHSTIGIDNIYHVERIESSIPHRLHRYRGSQRLDLFSEHERERAYRPDANARLGSLCSDFAQSKCEEKKDKVFGLWGIALDCCKEAVTIDYSVPWPRICSDVYVHYFQHHNHWDMVEASRKFHRSFKHTSQGLSDSNFELHAVDPDSINTWTRSLAKARGEISYLFPLSTTSSELSRILIERFSAHESFAALITRQIKRINEFKQDRGNLATWDDPKHDLDLVVAFPSPLCEAVLSSYSRKDDVSFSSTCQPNSNYEDSGHPLTLDHLWRLLEIEGIGHTLPFADTCSLAFQGDGTICFVPYNARVGDRVCSFSDNYPDLLALVRIDRDSRVGELIGRCVDFLPSNNKELRQGDADRIWIQLDLRTLHLLTRLSDREYQEAD